jgi:hypothetical protein
MTIGSQIGLLGAGAALTLVGQLVTQFTTRRWAKQGNLAQQQRETLIEIQDVAQELQILLWDSRGSDSPITQPDFDKKILRLVALSSRVVERGRILSLLSARNQIRMHGMSLENLLRQYRDRPAKDIPDVWFEGLNNDTLIFVRMIGMQLTYWQRH